MPTSTARRVISNVSQMGGFEGENGDVPVTTSQQLSTTWQSTVPGVKSQSYCCGPLDIRHSLGKRDGSVLDGELHKVQISPM